MRDIHVDEIVKAVRTLALRANTELGQDVLEAFQRAIRSETSPIGKDILQRLVENADIAAKEKIPLCQDTGMAVVFVEMGQEVHIIGGTLTDAVNEGVRQGYADGYLRKSVCHPFERTNTGDNTPAVLHLDLVAGDAFKIDLMSKGFGAENMSRVTLLAPAAGVEGIFNLVLERIRAAGANPCPPTIVGVGVGGTFEMAALMAKKALLRPLGTEHPDPDVARLEKKWLFEINRTGIGPQGLGGRTTCLAVHINYMATHIASIPVAINIQCHSSRHKTAHL